ncbi:hypothetical protein ACFX1T_013224 [Malus domestica]
MIRFRIVGYQSDSGRVHSKPSRPGFRGLDQRKAQLHSPVTLPWDLNFKEKQSNWIEITITQFQKLRSQIAQKLKVKDKLKSK